MKAIINIDAYRNSVFGALMQYESFFNDCMPGLGDALVGAKAYRPSPPGWVAEITGFDIKYKYERRFLLGKYDYSLAAASGKGRVIEFILESGRLYEVERIANRGRERFFCTVNGEGEIIRMAEEEATEWLKNIQLVK